MRWTSLLLITTNVFSAAVCHAQPVEQSRPSPTLPFRIGKETTRITEPLDDDGCVDYVRALDQLAKRGVTRDNNAAVILFRVLKPTDVNPELRRRLIDALQIEETVEVTPLEDFSFFENEQLREEFNGAIEGRWTPEKYPGVARWLQRNEKALKLIELASRRPRFYTPIDSEEAETEQGPVDIGLYGARNPFWNLMRNAIKTLTARAFLQTEGPAAWRDLSTASRLAGLMVQDRMQVGLYSALNSQRLICTAMRTCLLSYTWTAEKLEKMRAQFEALQFDYSISEFYNTTARWYFLDAVTRMSRTDMHTLKVINDVSALEPVARFQLVAIQSDPREQLRALGQRLVWHYVDWNEILQSANRRFDEKVAMAQLPPGEKRREEYEALKAQFRLHKVLSYPYEGELELVTFLDQTIGSVLEFIIPIPGYEYHYTMFVAPNRRAWFTRKFNHLTEALLEGGHWWLVPAEDRLLVNYRLTEMTFALLQFEREHKRYPKSLRDLTPKYLAQIPRDVYSGKPFGYESDGQSFLLYSVGQDGERDAEGEEKQHADKDIVVKSRPSRKE